MMTAKVSTERETDAEKHGRTVEPARSDRPPIPPPIADPYPQSTQPSSTSSPATRSPLAFSPFETWPGKPRDRIGYSASASTVAPAGTRVCLFNCLYFFYKFHASMDSYNRFLQTNAIDVTSYKFAFGRGTDGPMCLVWVAVATISPA